MKLEITEAGRKKANSPRLREEIVRAVETLHGRVPHETGTALIVARIALALCERDHDPPSPAEMREFIDRNATEIDTVAERIFHEVAREDGVGEA